MAQQFLVERHVHGSLRRCARREPHVALSVIDGSQNLVVLRFGFDLILCSRPGFTHRSLFGDVCFGSGHTEWTGQGVEDGAWNRGIGQSMSG